MTSYIDTNNAGAPATYTSIDTGISTVPTVRPSVFTPVTGYTAPATTGIANQGVAGNDWAVNTAPVVRPQVFEPPTDVVTIDLGLVVNG